MQADLSSTVTLNRVLPTKKSKLKLVVNWTKSYAPISTHPAISTCLLTSMISSPDSDILELITFIHSRMALPRQPKPLWHEVRIINQILDKVCLLANFRPISLDFIRQLQRWTGGKQTLSSIWFIILTLFYNWMIDNIHQQLWHELTQEFVSLSICKNKMNVVLVPCVLTWNE